MELKMIWSTIVALAMVCAVGCGGDDQEDSTAPVEATTPPSTLTKEDLLAQGDGICAEVNAALGSLTSTEAGAAARVAQEAGLYEGMVERLKGLGTPDDATGYDEFVDAADALAQAQSDAALAAARGDTTALQAAESEASSALASFQSAADAYGFEKCGEAPSAPPATMGTGTATEPEASEPVEDEAEVTPEAEPELEAPETGGAGSTQEGEAGGGASAGGGTSGGAVEGSDGGEGSGGIGPG
jgi:hypothetical protein